MVNKILVALPCLTFILSGVSVQAKEIDTNIARMQAMDKITGMVQVINVPVNSEVKYGSFSIVVRACKTRPPEETPENFAFVDVVDNYKSENPVNIFRGWMISSSPSLNPVEHPIYDIWLLSCENGVINPHLKIMNEEELRVREQIPQATTQVQNEMVDVKNIPTNILNREKENVDETMVAPVANIVEQPSVKQKTEPVLPDVTAHLSVTESKMYDGTMGVQDENTSSDGMPQALVNPNVDNNIKPQVLPKSEIQLQENVNQQNFGEERTEEVNISSERNLPVEKPLIAQEPSDNLTSKSVPFETDDISLHEDDMLSEEEFEENGMIDDQLINFSE